MTDLDRSIRAELSFRLADAQPRDAVDLVGVVVGVLDLCFVMDGQVTGEGDAEHSVAKMIRERIASKLGVSDD